MNTALARTPTWLMLGAFAAGMVLHVDRAPMWCLLAAGAIMVWHWLHVRSRVALPAAWLRIGITLLLFVAVMLSFRTLGGLAAGSALLIVMGAAKLLETRQQRDASVVAIVSLVLVLAAVLDRQHLLRMPLYLATGWLALATIAALGSVTTSRSARSAFRSSGATLLLAAPLAVLCFVLVPRMPGALWSMPPGGAAQTGLSDEMSPGSISDLAISEAVAFRVRFEDGEPPPQSLYWRGPVLHDFDGHTWRRRPGQAVREEPEPLSAPIRYQVMLEPHGRTDLFGLDTVASIEGRRSMRTFDGQVLAQRAVTSPIIYDAVSHLRVRYPAALSHTGRQLDTRLPAQRNPRSLALARELRAASNSDAEFSERVIDHLRQGGFAYTLTPPLLGDDSVDDLLFRTRLGFCGHYASAYATLMRAAGVPARVVTGYLGGTWNRIGNYFIVRQAEAHAWTEVWLEGHGWVRIDPTAVVAPERLRGLDAALGERRGAGAALLGEARWLRNLRDSWDAAGSWWQERVVNFNSTTQRDLLARLGLDRLDYAGLALLLGAGAALWAMLLLAWLSLRTRASRPDPLQRIWEDFIALLERRGVRVDAHDGPAAIAARARRALPYAGADIDSFARGYMRLRFGREATPDSRQELRALSAQLRQLARATAPRHRPRTAPAAPG